VSESVLVSIMEHSGMDGDPPLNDFAVVYLMGLNALASRYTLFRRVNGTRRGDSEIKRVGGPHHARGRIKHECQQYDNGDRVNPLQEGRQGDRAARGARFPPAQGPHTSLLGRGP